MAPLAFGFSGDLSAEQFLAATVIGKAAIKPTLQAIFIITLFTRGAFSAVLDFLKARLPLGAFQAAEAFLQSQRRLYQEPIISAPTVPSFVYLLSLSSSNIL